MSRLVGVDRVAGDEDLRADADVGLELLEVFVAETYAAVALAASHRLRKACAVDADVGALRSVQAEKPRAVGTLAGTLAIFEIFGPAGRTLYGDNLKHALRCLVVAFTGLLTDAPTQTNRRFHNHVVTIFYKQFAEHLVDDNKLFSRNGPEGRNNEQKENYYSKHDQSKIEGETNILEPTRCRFLAPWSAATSSSFDAW